MATIKHLFSLAVEYIITLLSGFYAFIMGVDAVNLHAKIRANVDPFELFSMKLELYSKVGFSAITTIAIASYYVYKIYLMKKHDNTGKPPKSD